VKRTVQITRNMGTVDNEITVTNKIQRISNITHLLDSIGRRQRLQYKIIHQRQNAVQIGK
jgi:hypothetical protein